MIYGITLAVLGVLAAPSFFLSKKPDAKEMLEKITPYQGWIGVVAFFWGVWGIIQAILSLGLVAKFFIWWVTWVTGSVMVVSLGFLLSYNMISQLVLSENEAARRKGAKLLATLSPLLGKLGLFAIVFGIWTTVASFLFN